MYCPYACPAGQVGLQWDPKATSYSYPISQNGGLYCNENGEIEKPFPEKDYCADGTGSAHVNNTCGGVISFCQTVLPGNEAMLIPTEVHAGTTEVIAVPDPSYWVSTAAHYYINAPGVGVKEGCVWGTKAKPIGNWSPYVAGANADASGNTFVKIGWNPVYLEQDCPFKTTLPNFGLRLVCDGSCVGLPCEINPQVNGVNEVTSLLQADGAGGGAFCVGTAQPGSHMFIEVFEVDEGSSTGFSTSESTDKIAAFKSSNYDENSGQESSSLSVTSALKSTSSYEASTSSTSSSEVITSSEAPTTSSESTSSSAGSETTTSVFSTSSLVPSATYSAELSTSSAEPSSSSIEPSTSSTESSASSIVFSTSSIESTSSSIEHTTSSIESTTSSVESTTSSIESFTYSLDSTTSSTQPPTSSSELTTSSVLSTFSAVSSTVSEITTSSKPNTSSVVLTTSSVKTSSLSLAQTTSSSTTANSLFSTSENSTVSQMDQSISSKIVISRTLQNFKAKEATVTSQELKSYGVKSVSSLLSESRSVLYNLAESKYGTNAINQPTAAAASVSAGTETSSTLTSGSSTAIAPLTYLLGFVSAIIAALVL